MSNTPMYEPHEIILDSRVNGGNKVVVYVWYTRYGIKFGTDQLNKAWEEFDIVGLYVKPLIHFPDRLPLYRVIDVTDTYVELGNDLREGSPLIRVPRTTFHMTFGRSHQRIQIG